MLAVVVVGVQRLAHQVELAVELAHQVGPMLHQELQIWVVVQEVMAQAALLVALAA
jgi:hypothetical protein